jgi:hypothetical protein
MKVKNAIISSLFCSFALAAQAQASTLISSRVVTVPVDISTAKVVKTNKGYGTTYLVKILVPGLAGPTLMNHRNEGESAPCLATYQTDDISDVTQGRPETVNADMKIDLVKDVYVSDGDKICHVTLTENISTTIRGFTFVHTRSAEMPTRDSEDCE